MLMLWRTFAFLRMDKKVTLTADLSYLHGARLLFFFSFLSPFCEPHWAHCCLEGDTGEETAAREKIGKEGEGKGNEKREQRVEQGWGKEMRAKAERENGEEKSLGVSSQQHVNLLSRLYMHTRWQGSSRLQQHTFSFISIVHAKATLLRCNQ